jgi:hypothetical protein
MGEDQVPVDLDFHNARGDESPYICGDCGEPIFRLDGERLYRPCGHTEAVVVANIEAIATGRAILK